MVKNFLIVLKNLQTDPIKTASKRAIQKTVEAIGDLLGNKIAGKITGISKKSTKESPKDERKEEDAEITTHKKRYISPEERQQIIDELRLIPKNY